MLFLTLFEVLDISECKTNHLQYNTTLKMFCLNSFFTDSGRNDAIIVNSASVSPYPVEMPGTLTAAIEFEVMRNMTEGIKLGVQITRTISLWGGYYQTHLEIPCYSMIGSW